MSKAPFKPIGKCLILLSLFLLGVIALGQDSDNPPPPPPPPGVGESTGIVDEDPFLDYSDFDADPQQEMDERFFRNGRFFMFSLMAGHTNFTSNLGSLYSSAPLNTLGGKFTYFFDLQWALEIMYLQSKHSFALESTIPEDDLGSISVHLSRILVGLKYYFNTRNLNAFLAKLNPYVGFGVGTFYRRQVFIDLSNKTVSDNAVGGSLSLGIDYPLKEKSTYLTFEGRYSYVTFQDEGDTSLSDIGIPTLDGDPWEFLGGITLSW